MVSSYIKNILQNVWLMYLLTIIGCLFLSGSIIRIYGETCGITLSKPTTWISTFLLMGSPYCKILNYIGHISGSIMENLWIHIISSIVSKILLVLPFMKSQ